jgi:hypothetical protein
VIQRWTTGSMIEGSSPSRGWEVFSSLPRPERLWSPSSLLSNGYQGLFPWGQGVGGVKLTPHLHLVPRSRKHGAILPLPQYAFMASCSVKKKVQGQLYLYHPDPCRVRSVFSYFPDVSKRGLWYMRRKTHCCRDWRTHLSHSAYFAPSVGGL